MRILFIVFVALMCGSCFEKGDCVINNSNLIKIDFINIKDKADYPITFESIRVMGSSIVLYNDGTAVSSIELPVDPNKTETSFIISRAGVLNDTLTVTYVNETIIPSSDCGAFIYQKQVTMVKKPFEGTVIKEINNQLLRNATVNFEIYF